MTTGQLIQKQRESHRMSQQDVAQALSVPVEEVAGWEEDRAIPDLITASRLAALFAIRMEDLVEPDPNHPAPPRQWNSVKIMLCGILVVLLSMALSAVPFAVFGRRRVPEIAGSELTQNCPIPASNERKQGFFCMRHRRKESKKRLTNGESV